jgi:hypothetical protein
VLRTLTAARAVTTGVGLVLLGATAGCGSDGERASWGSAAGPSPSTSPSPTRTESSPTQASPPAAANGDLRLRLLKVDGHPSCTVYMTRPPVEPDNIGLPSAVVAFTVDGLPNADGATVSLTSPPPGTESGVMARFNADGTLRQGDVVHLDGAPKVTYYAFPVDLRRIINKTVSFTLVVDPDDRVKEPNEKNNALKLRLTTRGVIGPDDLTKGYPSGAGNRCVKVS